MSPRTRKPADPRHAAVKAVLVKYWAAERNTLVPELPWGAGDAGALGAFLQANPTMTVEMITELLRNRLKSDDHARGEPVKVWIGSITRYAEGPLNQYKQPKKGGQDGKRTRTDERNEHAAGASAAALSRLQKVARD